MERRRESVFQFESKIGWGELIATLALIASIAAIVQQCQSSKPSPQIIDLDAKSMVPSWTVPSKFLVTNQPFAIVNNGGRATTLLTVASRRDLDPAKLVRAGQTQPVVGKIETYVTGPMTEDWRFESGSIFRGEKVARGRRAAVNQTIEPGGSSVFYVTFVYEPYEGLQTRADFLAVALEASFSDGSIVPVNVAVAIPPRRASR
jgi:hypothetical protein